MPVSAGEIVRINTAISSQVRDRIGKTLFLTTEYTAGEPLPFARTREYTRLTGVSNNFAATSPAYRAAQRYFGGLGNPQPFVVGFWFDAAYPNALVGGAYADSTALDTAAAAITDTNCGFVFDGQEYTGIDFSAATTGATAVTAINAALPASVGALSVAGANFTLTMAAGLPLTSYMSAPTTAGVTDLSELLKMRTEDSPTVTANGTADADIAAALNACLAASDNIYFVTMEEADGNDANVASLSQAVNAEAVSNDIIYVGDVRQTAALTAGESGSVAALVAAAGPTRTALIYSDTAGDYKSVALATLFSSLNLSLPNSIITAKFKQLRGATSDDLSLAQRNELTRKHVNWYGAYGARGLFAEGEMMDGEWIDVRYWLRWFESSVQNAIMQLAIDHPRVSLTTSGIAILRDTVEHICDIGVRNGGLAPGTVSDTVLQQIRDQFNLPDFNGLLSTGYLVHIQSLDEQTARDRTARYVPPITVYMKGSGALHFVNISAVFTA